MYYKILSKLNYFVIFIFFILFNIFYNLFILVPFLIIIVGSLSGYY